MMILIIKIRLILGTIALIGISDAAREVPVTTLDLLGLQVENMAATMRGRDGLGHRFLATHSTE